MSVDLVATNRTLSLSRGLFGIPPDEARAAQKDRDRKVAAHKQSGR